MVLFSFVMARLFKQPDSNNVIPAQAGIQRERGKREAISKDWIPTFVGMTHTAIWLAVYISLSLIFPVQANAQIFADEIVVEKHKRLMTLYNDDKVIKRYHITLGKSAVGAKVREGDNKTPEGYYFIDGRKLNSEFHLALHISYPDELDIERAQKLGVDPGGRIMIHGRPEDYGTRRRKRDWTHGCISVSNQEIEEIWRLVPDGTPIEIKP